MTEQSQPTEQPLMIIQMYICSGISRGVEEGNLEVWNLPKECATPCIRRKNFLNTNSWWKMRGFISPCRCAINRLLLEEKFWKEVGDSELVVGW